MSFVLSAFVVKGLIVPYRPRMWLVTERREMVTQIQRNVIYIFITLCSCSEPWMLASAPM